MAVPYTFGSATTSIPLSQLDSNFATTITLGNTAIQLGNTVTTLNNMTLANVTISSGTSNLASTSISNGTSNVTIASSGGAIAMATNGTTAVTIDTSQNVGIGTTSPATKLDLYSAGATDVDVRFANGTGTGLVGVRSDNYFTELRAVSNHGIMFSTNNSERMRIDSSGKVNINSTTNLGGILQVNGNIAPTAQPTSYWGIDFGTSTSAGSYVTLAYGATYDMAGGAGVIWVFEQSSSVGAVQALCAYGSVTLIANSGSYSTTFNTASKTNIYYNGGTGTYRIQNLSSSPTTYSYWIASMRVRSGA